MVAVVVWGAQPKRGGQQKSEIAKVQYDEEVDFPNSEVCVLEMYFMQITYTWLELQNIFVVGKKSFLWYWLLGSIQYKLFFSFYSYRSGLGVE